MSSGSGKEVKNEVDTNMARKDLKLPPKSPSSSSGGDATRQMSSGSGKVKIEVDDTKIARMHLNFPPKSPSSSSGGDATRKRRPLDRPDFSSWSPKKPALNPEGSPVPKAPSSKSSAIESLEQTLHNTIQENQKYAPEETKPEPEPEPKHSLQHTKKPETAETEKTVVFSAPKCKRDFEKLCGYSLQAASEKTGLSLPEFIKRARLEDIVEWNGSRLTITEKELLIITYHKERVQSFYIPSSYVYSKFSQFMDRVKDRWGPGPFRFRWGCGEEWIDLNCPIEWDNCLRFNQEANVRVRLTTIVEKQDDK